MEVSTWSRMHLNSTPPPGARTTYKAEKKRTQSWNHLHCKSRGAHIPPLHSFATAKNPGSTGQTYLVSAFNWTNPSTWATTDLHYFFHRMRMWRRRRSISEYEHRKGRDTRLSFGSRCCYYWDVLSCRENVIEYPNDLLE